MTRILIRFGLVAALLAAGSASAQFIGEGIWRRHSGAAPANTAVATALVIPNQVYPSPSTVVAPIGGM